MRRNILTLLLLFTLLFTACSYPIDFVVVNESSSSIEVRLKVFGFPGEPLDNPELPAKVATSQLGSGDWRELGASEYQVGRENRTIVVRVLPNEALRVARVPDSDMRDGEPISCSVEEITITGADGELKLEGGQVRKAFVSETKRIYRLTYK
jgi:hypothetical protein